MLRRCFLGALAALILLVAGDVSALQISRAPLLGALASGPTLDLDFIKRPIESRLSFTRASVANYFDSTGTIQSASANNPRFDYDPIGHTLRGLLMEQQRTNSIRNPRGEGGSSSTLPTNWTIFVVGPGLTAPVVGSGTEFGMHYTDVQVVGTPTTTTGFRMSFDAGLQAAAASGNVWTASLYVRLVGGSLANISPYIEVHARTSGNARQDVTDVGVNPVSALGRAVSTGAAFTTGAAFSGMEFAANVAGGSAPVDVTLRLYSPQLEFGNSATSIILPTAGSQVMSTRAADNLSLPVGGWYNPSRGTLAVEWIPAEIPDDYFSPVALVGSDAANVWIEAGQHTAGTTFMNYGANSLGSPGITVSPGQNATVGVIHRMAYSWGLGEKSSWGFDGLAWESTGTTSAVPVVNSLVIAGFQHFQQGRAAAIRRIRYWPHGLPVGELKRVNQ